MHSPLSYLYWPTLQSMTFKIKLNVANGLLDYYSNGNESLLIPFI